jgi:16S rRNA pseudouridine516 synthase
MPQPRVVQPGSQPAQPPILVETFFRRQQPFDTFKHDESVDAKQRNIRAQAVILADQALQTMTPAPCRVAATPRPAMLGVMQLQDILFSQGFGTRRVCIGLIQQGHVRVPESGDPCLDPWSDWPTEGLHFEVMGQVWAYHAHAYLMLHKPAGHECSQKPSAWPSIYTLLPAPLRQRPQGAACGVQAVGRLDQDTTGLLLLSDDGRFIHRLSSPRHHVPKVYEVVCRHPVETSQITRLLQGVVLDDDPRPVRAAACEPLEGHGLRLTLTEGKYHQVKRMVAAVGNRVESLHRSRIGPLRLPADLSPGQWRWLTPEQVAGLTAKA